MRQNDVDKGKTNHASTKRLIRRKVVERGLLNHALGDTLSRSSTGASSANCITRRTVKGAKEQNGHCCEYKYYMWVILTSVFKLTFRMQAGIHRQEAAFILSMVSSIKDLASIKLSCLIVEYLGRSKLCRLG